MGTSQSTEIQVFSGGINVVPAPHLLGASDSRILAGANLRKGNLHPFLAPLFVESASDSYMYFFNSKYEYYPRYRSNVLYNRVWYWTDSIGAGKKYYDDTEVPLGIDPPIGRPLATEQSAVNGLTGTISYVYTYFDPKSGSESPPSQPSNTLDLIGDDADKSVEISSLNPSPEGYQIRLYRIGGYQTVYTAVDTLSSTATDYIDDKSYSEMQGMILDTIRAYPPPTGLQYLTLHQGRFFGAVNAELVFTPPGKPDSWYALDYLAFDDVITAVISVANGLIVTSRHKTWLVTGLQPTNFAIHTLSSSEGCINIATVAVQDGTAIWLSSSGFLMSNGAGIDNVSLFKLGRVSALEPYGAVYVDKRYMMSFGGSLFPSTELFPSENLHPSDIITEEGIALPKGAVVIDFSTGIPAYSTITDVVMGYITEAENEIYQLSNDGDEAFNIVTEDGKYNLVTEIGESVLTAMLATGSSLEKSFKGEGLRTITYVSPLYTEGALAVLKQYEKVRVSYSGIGYIEIYDENHKQLKKQELSSEKLTSEWVYLPVNYNRAYGIQFKLEGVIKINSIQWIWVSKESQ